MADGLFLMQRYLGSDDENLGSECSNQKTENFEPKKKKTKKHSSHATQKNEEDCLSKSFETEDSNWTKKDCKHFSNNSELSKHGIEEIEKHEQFEETNCNKNCGFELISSNGASKKKIRKKKKSSGEKNNANDSIIHLNDDKDSQDTEQKKIAFRQKNSLKTQATPKIKSEHNKSNILEKENSKIGENEEENFSVIGQKKVQNTAKIKPTLPKWLSNPSVISNDLKEQEITLSELSYLDDCTKKSLNEFGVKFLFPVQLAVIPWLIDVHRQSLFIRPSDLCVSAPTGSGKTLAFVIPIVQSLKKRVVCAVRAIVVLPVGELAIQVHKVFEAFVRNTDLKVVLLTGQKSFSAEQHALVRQNNSKVLSLADIVVTTPGRILDHIHCTKGFCLQKLQYLVIDEADRMMEDIQKGWLKQIEDAVYKNKTNFSCACFSIKNQRITSIQSTACSFGQINVPLQKLLFSATLSHDPEKLHTLSLYRPKLYVTQEKYDSKDWIGKCPLPEDLILQHIICDAAAKPLVLCHYIKKYQFKKILCFTESVERAQRLQFILEEMGFLRSREISSNYRPVQRKIILEQFNSGKIDIIVCSDLVARGIDIQGVDCVISYDVPPFLKNYIHRIGRTARAGKGGTAVALVTKDELPHFKKMLLSGDMTMPDNLSVNTQDLQEYVNAFEKALKVADIKLRKLKNVKNRINPSKKKQYDRKQKKTMRNHYY